MAMASWSKLAMIFTGLGFEMNLLSMISVVNYEDDVEAMLIIGFLAYIGAVVLILLLTFTELAGNAVIVIVTIVCLFVAGLYEHI